MLDRPLRRPLLLAVATLGLAPLLAACTPTIGVPVAEDATDPVCAEVVLATPDELDDSGELDRARTNSQATTAWGEPGAAVTLRCGVEAPGPSADCQSVESSAGSVDWIVSADEQGTWTFTTYGREPAVQVVIPPAVKEAHSSSFVADLNAAVSKVPQTKACTSAAG